jgi:mannose-6-phosphate isomerase-like protein (cupin superfamily)
MKTLVSVALIAVAVNIGRAQVIEKNPSQTLGEPKDIVATNAPSAPTAPAAATYFDAAKVAAVFEKGGTLFKAPDYKVMAGRRGTPGYVEIHTYETDVFYIVDGTATFVTGGTCADAKVTEPGQLRGTAITGGETHHLKKGDVIIVPAGLPHQYTEVSNPFLYFIVKSIRGQ